MSPRPSFYALASEQDGYFAAWQAVAAGYSRPALTQAVDAGRLVHARRGVYRLVEYPAGENEDIVQAWLWSTGLDEEHEGGVVSHETALALHGLSDALPALIHLSVPASWRCRRMKVPAGVRLHFQDVPPEDRAWHGAVPVTKPLRAVIDSAVDHVQPDLVAQAVRDGVARGLFAAADVARILPVTA